MVNAWITAAVLLLGVLMPAGAIRWPMRAAGDPPPFDSWLTALVDEAVHRGFQRRLVEQALADVKPLPRVLELDRRQVQSPPDLDAYLSERVTPELIARGREQMAVHRALLEQIERAFGVESRFLVAIWGAETGYGTYTGDIPVFQALATLAWEPRRASYFRRELFNALEIVSGGRFEPMALTGSWAGAMGQPQFMPSSYLQYAIDYDHDGRRDIWTSVADTLASIANYLRRFGWQTSGGWGQPVTVTPEARARIARDVLARTSGCGAIRALTGRRPVAAWSQAGIRQPDGSPLQPAHVPASVLALDARVFLVYPNYESILAYNCSHRYALSVSLLAAQLDLTPAYNPASTIDPVVP